MKVEIIRMGLERYLLFLKKPFKYRAVKRPRGIAISERMSGCGGGLVR